ncbi:hypothetical protein METHPM2_10061 [Pseudomonas sp. PM2]
MLRRALPCDRRRCKSFCATSGRLLQRPILAAVQALVVTIYAAKSTQVVVALGSFWYKAALFSRGPVPSL